MVTIMPSNPWRCADFLERVRPGIAISAAIHAGLFILLGYLLAFHRGLQVEAPPEDPPFIVVDPPRPPLQPVQVQTSTNIKPIVTREIDRFHPPQMITPLQPNDQPTDSRPKEPPVTAPPVIINPTPIYRGDLIYPVRAAEAEQQGYVDFDFIIEPDGTVGEPHIVSELPPGYGFAASAMKAFPKWRFKPMIKDGHPVAAPAHIRVTFKLS